MRCVIRQIAEERTIFVFGDEFQGMVCQIINYESLSSYDFSVMLENRIEIISPVPGAETVIIVETPGVRVIGILSAVVPFPISRGYISGRFECIADGFFVNIQSFLSGRDAAHAAT